MTIVSAFQSLGAVDQLIARDDQSEFAYPDLSSVLVLLGNGTSERNYVLQVPEPSVRQSTRSWVLVPTADQWTIRGYATSKSEVSLTEEDGTVRTVVVTNFAARQRYVGFWDVTVTLLETGDPDLPGS